MNDTFDASINRLHVGITPLALACALNLVDVMEVRIICFVSLCCKFNYRDLGFY